MTMLDGKVALVTGATRGIGQAIAVALARQGARVVGTATTIDGAQRIAAELAAIGEGHGGVALDVADAARCEAVVADVAARFGDIAILVNNAGITRDNLLMRLTESDWDTVLDTDLKSVFLLSKLVLRPMMKARYGRIVNITSVVAAMGNAGQVNYAAAKAGMVGFTRSLAREVASRNITVNAVAPGFIDTDMTRALTDDQRKRLTEHIPLGRFGSGADVAGAVLYLVSPAGDYVTGATLHVNGGMHME
jgi:3-oxoacyl-[acyl-carrier protein] reductase